MNRDEFKGKATNVKGRVKQAAGTLTGDRKLESEGLADRAKGAIQSGIGKAERAVDDKVNHTERKR